MVKFTKEIKRKIFQVANKLRKIYKVNPSESLKIAWKNAKLKIALHKGGVHFEYLKKATNEVREAFGTLHNVENYLRGSYKFQNDILTTRYFDLEKQEFRAFKVINLLSVENY